ncbi:MAG TPA: hypothetical protein VL981_05210 [Candidatus Methylacidiphilales bacterium]|nr:hypothetical protein [Candidatus Methylacidiphilales bacterium]
MKLIVIHADPPTRRNLVQLLDELNHVVVAEPSQPEELLNALARHQPHAVIVGHLSPHFSKETLLSIEECVPSAPILWLPDDDSKSSPRLYLEDALQRLASPPAAKKIQPYCSEQQRLIVHDDRYRPFAPEEKFKTTTTSQFDPEREEDLFLLQVCSARQNQASARRYLEQLLATDLGLQPECAYQTAHASYKVYWLREHAMRFASVLAHYIDGVETEYLPSPATPSTTVDFLHYEPSAESLYVASALTEHGFCPAFMPSFRSILGRKFVGQPDELLIADAIFLSGWCAFLREVAVAQVQFMATVLDVNSKWQKSRKPSRSLLRAEAIFSDFWSLSCLRQHPDRMRELARVALTEELTPVAPCIYVAPYRDFWKTYLSGQTQS